MSIDRSVRHGLACAVLLAGLGAAAAPAWAARLGALTVVSERSQPFEAEVELDDVSDASSAVPQVVAPSTYADLGVPFPAVLRGATVTVERRPSDGRSVVRIRAQRPADTAEVIVVMALTTATGRHLRSYRVDVDAVPSRGTPPPAAATPTLRVEPPAPAPAPALPAPTGADVRAASVLPSAEPPRMEPPGSEVRVEALPSPSLPPAVALPTARTPAAPSGAAVEPRTPSLVPEPRPVPPSSDSRSAADTRPAPARADAAPAAPRAASPAPAVAPAARGAAPAATAGKSTITVARGDTARSLAGRVKPADVTDAQAALALFRNNPQGFAGSVHRPRPGATLVVPDPEQMRALPAPIADSAFRRAGGARPGSGSGPASPIATREPGDRLKLSAGGTGRGKSLDRQGGPVRDIAFDAAMSEARSRITQLESIVAGLEKLIAERERQIGELTEQMRVAGRPVPAPGPAASGPLAATGAAPATPPAAPPAMLPNGMAPPEPVAAPAQPAAAATMLSEPSRRPAPPPVPMPELEPEPWWMDPMVLATGGGVVVLLLVLVIMRRRNAAPRARGRGRRAAAA